MINFEEFRSQVNSCKETMSKILDTHDQIMAKLEKENPEQFEKIAKDTRAVRESKSIEEINQILSKYANFNNQ